MTEHGVHPQFVETDSDSRIHYLAVSHALLATISQWLDLATTKKMISLHGIGAEANYRAQDMFLHYPTELDLLKIIIIPLIISYAFLLTHHIFMKRKDDYRKKNFEYIPFQFAQILNLAMVTVVVVNTGVGTGHLEQIMKVMYSLGLVG